jgi:hypothetical protein
MPSPSPPPVAVFALFMTAVLQKAAEELVTSPCDDDDDGLLRLKRAIATPVPDSEEDEGG